MAETTSKQARKKGAKTIVRAYFEALAEHDLDAATALWKPGSVDRLHGMAELRAPEGIREYFNGIFAAFPDFRFEIVDLVASGDLAAVRWRTDATFTGPGRFQGLAPTGARVHLEGCDMLRVEDELIVENNAYTNGAHLAEQLGLLPAPDSAAARAMTGAFNAKTAAVEAIRRLRERA